MKAIFGSAKEFKNHCYGTPPSGNFGLEPDAEKQFHWDHCREQFASKFTSDSAVGFFFTHPEGKGEDVANFLVKFEHIVGVKDYSIFAKTSKDDILWVGASIFWMPCMMKRSLLTIVLRCAMNYNSTQDNFDDALFGEYKESIYVRETKSAVVRFMFGFTKFTGQIYHHPVDVQSSVIKHGWREEFQKIDDSLVRRRLVLPENGIKETSIVGLESLWV